MKGGIVEKILLIIVVGWLAQFYAYPILNATLGRFLLPAPTTR